MAKRKFLTPAERIARAKAEEEKIIKSETGKSYDLTVKSVGWATRSVELGNKSDGARAQAVSKLVALGQTEDEAEAQVSAWEIEIAMQQASAEDKAEAAAAEAEASAEERGNTVPSVRKAKIVANNVAAKKAEQSA